MSRKESDAAYREANKDKIAEYKAAYREANKDKIAEYTAAYRSANKDKRAAYYQANKDKIAEQVAAYRNNRYKTDPMYALTERTRSLICKSLRNKGYSKRSRTHEILGCSFYQFKTHLESQFKQGMSWENRHLWHIDHRKPLATAKTEQEILKLNHFTNLQPLWAEENLKKGARYG